MALDFVGPLFGLTNKVESLCIVKEEEKEDCLLCIESRPAAANCYDLFEYYLHFVFVCNRGGTLLLVYLDSHKSELHIMIHERVSSVPFSSSSVLVRICHLITRNETVA